MHEFVFCRIMKLNKWICAKKKANGLCFYKGHDEVKEGQPIGVRNQTKFAPNQTKFAPNPSPIRIRILAFTPVSIWSITFGLDDQSRCFRLGWKSNLKGYNFVVYKKAEF